MFPRSVRAAGALVVASLTLVTSLTTPLAGAQDGAPAADSGAPLTPVVEPVVSPEGQTYCPSTDDFAFTLPTGETTTLGTAEPRSGVGFVTDPDNPYYIPDLATDRDRSADLYTQRLKLARRDGYGLVDLGVVSVDGTSGTAPVCFVPKGKPPRSPQCHQVIEIDGDEYPEFPASIQSDLEVVNSVSNEKITGDDRNRPPGRLRDVLPETTLSGAAIGLMFLGGRIYCPADRDPGQALTGECSLFVTDIHDNLLTHNGKPFFVCMHYTNRHSSDPHTPPTPTVTQTTTVTPTVTPTVTETPTVTTTPEPTDPARPPLWHWLIPLVPLLVPKPAPAPQPVPQPAPEPERQPIAAIPSGPAGGATMPAVHVH